MYLPAVVPESLSLLYLEELGARTLLEINISYKAKQNFIFLYKMNLEHKAISRITRNTQIHCMCN